MTFTSFGIHSTLLNNIAALGYTEPTPIQVEAIPVAMSGRDVIGLAQTGTGKTAAFALPVLNKLLASDQRGVPRLLVIAPTRELADQIYNAFKELGRGTGLRGVCVYGGASMRQQMHALAEGVDVIVACPGRLLDHLERGTLDPVTLDTVILDEADQMLDMGFLPVIRKIRRYLPVERQTLLFSATLPEEVRQLAAEFVRSPKRIKVGESGLSSTVSHNMYAVGDSQKNPLLLKVLTDLTEGSAIIFTRTKRRAKKIGEFLNESGAAAASLQGNLSQSKRRDALGGFRSGKYKVLVATDIAARGIDISTVSLVVNYDMPDTVEAYTHRTGRTGRALRSGSALSFATTSDTQIVRRIRTDLKLALGDLPMPSDMPAPAKTTRSTDVRKSFAPSDSAARQYGRRSGYGRNQRNSSRARNDRHVN